MLRDNEFTKGRIQYYNLANRAGLSATITNYGGRVVALYIPDKNGVLADVVLGFDGVDGYFTAREKYFGALIGRYGNRIANGRFLLNGREYKLACNNGAHHLHGGHKGLHTVVWEAEKTDHQTVELSYLSPDGEDGYPGNLRVKVTYTLTDNQELQIEYFATTDAATIINLTHHSFFNLSGELGQNISDHHLTIFADHYLPIDEGSIPTGAITSVTGTPFDFRRPKSIGQALDQQHEQLSFGRGYDHNFVLQGAVNEAGMQLAAEVLHPSSGRRMEVWTTEPGLQFYGGNFLEGKDIGKDGTAYPFRSAFCLETQHFPDSPNHPNFPSTVLEPGQTYQSRTIYRFGLQ
jgi:aldose 1-epimerase